jgi:hypothetical protein
MDQVKFLLVNPLIFKIFNFKATIYGNESETHTALPSLDDGTGVKQSVAMDCSWILRSLGHGVAILPSAIGAQR